METVQKWLRPDPKIVELSRDLRRRGYRRAFDLGCGVGRHVIFLAKEGWDVYASDFSEPAVAYCLGWLSREGISATVAKMDMTEIPYPDDFFDLIIAYNVIYHTTLASMIELIHLTYRKLRAGGYFFVTLKSTEEWVYGQGKEIEKNTFFRPNKGVPVHFCTEEEIGTLFKDFELASKEYFNYVKDRTHRRYAFWEIILQKPVVSSRSPEHIARR